jgi:hypothetical protein
MAVALYIVPLLASLSARVAPSTVGDGLGSRTAISASRSSNCACLMMWLLDRPSDRLLTTRYVQFRRTVSPQLDFDLADLQSELENCSEALTSSTMRTRSIYEKSRIILRESGIIRATIAPSTGRSKEAREPVGFNL